MCFPMPKGFTQFPFLTEVGFCYLPHVHGKWGRENVEYVMGRSVGSISKHQRRYAIYVSSEKGYRTIRLRSSYLSLVILPSANKLRLTQLLNRL